ncbi:MAG: ABC transporter ATP-binding protein [Chloroflexi bacterium]|nr:ABC transporter ATP-binding protein [Chloroflexota bacterium]
MAGGGLAVGDTRDYSGDQKETGAGVVVAQGLVKTYGTFRAVDGIAFAIEHGECFGFLGPNGAGKTSTMRMIQCVSPVSAGSLTVLGSDVRTHARQIKARLGVVPQDNNLDPDLSVRKNLLTYARYFELPGAVARQRVEEALDLFQLLDRQHSRIDDLSGGMKRRLVIARALLNQPDLLILDEPTTGLDPQARRLVWQKLRALRARGMTMILTTHYMEEAAELCDRLVIMDRGRIVAQGTPQALVAAAVGRSVLQLRADAAGAAAVARRLAGEGVACERVEDMVYCYSQDDDLLRRVAAALDGQVAERTIRLATLEDVFLRLTGHALQE